MSIQYDIFKNSLKTEDEAMLQAQFVSQGTITTEKLIAWMSKIAGYHPGQIKGILTTLNDAVLDFLEDGYEVQLGELGYFSVSLTSRQVKDRKEIRAESVRFKKLNFRASSQTRNRLKSAKIERVDTPVKRSVSISREDRIARIKKILSGKPFITRAEYMRITGVLKDKALSDLKSFIEEGWLDKYGAGKTIVYLLKKDQ